MNEERRKFSRTLNWMTGYNPTITERRMEIRTQESEKFWSNQSGSDWLKKYADSSDRKDRDELIDILHELKWNSIFEVGCNCAPILTKLKKWFNDFIYEGLDINGRALDYGKFLHPNAKFFHGSAFTELSKFPSDSYDVVLSCSFLSSIAPDDVKNVLNEMIRISKHYVVIQEPKYEQHNGIFHWWNHNYARIQPNGKIGIEIVVL